MKEDLMLLRTMPWKHRGIMLCLGIISFILCYQAFDSPLLVVKGFIFSSILLVASYFDIRTRIIPDWIHVLILLVGLIGFEPVRSIVGLIVAPLPFLVMALIQDGSIGGGDVKLIGGVGFVYGLRTSLLLIILSFLFAILHTVLYNSRDVDKKKLVFHLHRFYFWGG